MPDIIYSKKLDLNYKIKYDNDGNKVVVFEDGVNYKAHEMKKINDCSDSVLKSIHQIKKIYKGIIL